MVLSPNKENQKVVNAINCIVLDTARPNYSYLPSAPTTMVVIKDDLVQILHCMPCIDRKEHCKSLLPSTSDHFREGVTGILQRKSQNSAGSLTACTVYIAHISHHRHHWRWYIFFKPVHVHANLRTFCCSFTIREAVKNVLAEFVR